MAIAPTRSAVEVPPSTEENISSGLPKVRQTHQRLAVAVARVGNNLNQIARTVNLKQKSGPMDAILVANQLAQIRREMREELRAVSAQSLREVADGGKKSLSTVPDPVRWQFLAALRITV